MSKRVLTGLGWDHPRGFACLEATARAFAETRPDIEIRWEARSLRDFGEAPIEPLARRYDLIIIDHPFSGQARTSGCLVDLGELMPEAVAAARADSVGLSAQSYAYDGGVWALPTDAAAQVAAYRPDLLRRSGLGVPETHDDVVRLGRALRREGLWIAVPSGPTDAICQVLSYAANLGDPVGAAEGVFTARATLLAVLDLLDELLRLAHPSSTALNPIAAYEAMAQGDEIAYAPLLFGYSNYARDGDRPVVRAANFAGPGRDPVRGALLGGAGCAISSRCRDLEAARDYVSWLHGKDVMSGLYFDAGGQPGSRAAWASDAVNARANGFFADTQATLDAAYLRPRFSGFVNFMETAGLTVNAYLKGERGRQQALDTLLGGYARAWDAHLHQRIGV